MRRADSTRMSDEVYRGPARSPEEARTLVDAADFMVRYGWVQLSAMTLTSAIIGKEMDSAVLGASLIAVSVGWMIWWTWYFGRQGRTRTAAYRSQDGAALVIGVPPRDAAMARRLAYLLVWAALTFVLTPPIVAYY